MQLFLDSLPLRLNRQAIKGLLEVSSNQSYLGYPFYCGSLQSVKDSLLPIESIVGSEFGDGDAVFMEAVGAVIDYCRHHLTEVTEFFIQATHVYFVYLRNPTSPDYVAVVITRLIELLTATPDMVHSIWMEELPKHDVIVWKGLIRFESVRVMFDRAHFDRLCSPAAWTFATS